MKKIITAILILISVNAFGQDAPYNGEVKFNLTDSVEGSYVFARKAIFETMIYNQKVQTIALQWKIKFFNAAGILDVKMVAPYFRETIIDNKHYVVTATGVYVGTITQVLALYGKPSGNPEDPWLKLPSGRYDLTTPCMGEYDYWMKGFDNNQKLHQSIKNHGQRIAAETGNLN